MVDRIQGFIITDSKGTRNVFTLDLEALREIVLSESEMKHTCELTFTFVSNETRVLKFDYGSRNIAVIEEVYNKITEQWKSYYSERERSS